jgi:GH15 family glucan-1,4-alpha-glucosidase
VELNLYSQSISVILKNQSAAGAYLASPTFAPYRFCWFRDSSYIAYAMNLVGQHESARKFHDWASRTILRYEAKFRRGIESARQGVMPAQDGLFHPRFTVEGVEIKDGWPNHQLDGLGTWLWSMVQHIKLTRASPIPEHWRQAVELAVDYLMALWKFPCFDCWEENGDGVHTYTLSAIYGGLLAAADTWDEIRAGEVAGQIRTFVLENTLNGNQLVKSIGSSEIDASLLGVAQPYRLLALQHPIMFSTVTQIEQELGPLDSGVRRYERDTYYGGGEWLLLTAWLGWYYAELGQIDRARMAQSWIEAQVTPSGDLPEQVQINLNDPRYYPSWVEQWGKVATPLLWSHAMYLILSKTLRR